MVDPEDMGDAADLPYLRWRDLRECMRDLVAFAALRAMWSGQEAAAIVESFADALLSLVHARLVLVRFRLDPAAPAMEVLRTADGALSPRQALRAARQLAPLLAADSVGTPLRIASPIGRGSLALVVVPFGHEPGAGFVGVGSPVAGFPDDLQRALLGVATSQVAVALRERELFELASRERAAAAMQESEAELRRKTELLQAIFDHIPVMIALADRRGKLEWVNREWERVLGWSLDEVRGRDMLAEAFPDPVRQAEVASFVRRQPPEWRDFPTRIKDGRTLHTTWANFLLSDDRLVAFGQDVTERKRTEEERERRARESARLLEEVTAARQRLETLSRRLVDLQEQERHSIARELHDEVGQILTGLNLMLETTRRGADLDLAAVKDLVGQLQERVRDLSLNLRPPMLDDLGLVATLLWHIERYRAQTGIHVRFHHRGLASRLPSGTEIAAYRIVQEALTNVARHAAVAEASVELWARGRMLELRVEDAGKGFDPGALAGPSSGLTGMRERALLAGGSLAIGSRPGSGTRLLARLPMTAPPEP